MRAIVTALLSLTIMSQLSAPAMGQGSKHSPKPQARTKQVTKIKVGTDPKDLARFIVNDVVSVGPIHADRSKKVFYWPGCPKFDSVSLKNKVIFGDDEEAERAGYKPAKDCRQ
jgi:hypothetical protein